MDDYAQRLSAVSKEVRDLKTAQNKAFGMVKFVKHSASYTRVSGTRVLVTLTPASRELTPFVATVAFSQQYSLRFSPVAASISSSGVMTWTYDNYASGSITVTAIATGEFTLSVGSA